MDLITFVVICCVFTALGFVWCKTSPLDIKRISRIVGSTMDSLEKDGYLKSEIIDGEKHYVKWPKG